MSTVNSKPTKQDLPQEPFVWTGDTEETGFHLLPEGYYEFETIGFECCQRINQITGKPFWSILIKLKIFHPDGTTIINCSMSGGSKLANSYFSAINFPVGMQPTSKNTVGTRAGCRLIQQAATVKTINIVERFINSNT